MHSASKFYTSVLKRGNNILAISKENGQRHIEKIKFQPSLFIKSKNETENKTLDGQFVVEKKFDCINDAKDFIEKYDDVDGIDIYGTQNFEYQYIAQEYAGDINWDINDFRVISCDIETKCENGFPDPHEAPEEILLINVHDKTTKKSIVFGSRDYNKSEEDEFEYIKFKDEVSLLKGFVLWWESDYPDILTGWNVEGFDVPYLINRMNKMLGEEWTNRLSPWKVITNRHITLMGKSRPVWDILGINILDYADLMKKYTYSQRESWTLDSIAYEELGVNKLELPGTFRETYTNHFDTFVRYNARDGALVDMLDEKHKFIELVIKMAFLVKCNLKDTFGPVKTWDIFIYNHLREKNIVIPPSKRSHARDFPGGFVKEPVPAMYGWLMSFDFGSLYPNILRQWNMSPETIIGVMPDVDVDKFMSGDFEKPDDCTIAANGAMFSKERTGMIPELISKVLSGRKIAKNEMLKLESEYEKTKDESLTGRIASLNGSQMAYKILANAVFGALSNAGFRYFDIRIAEAITLTGQACDRYVADKTNEMMCNILELEKDFIIAMDTDSFYLDVNDVVKRMGLTDKDKIIDALDRFGQTKLQKTIDSAMQTLYDNGNCYVASMSMKREAIASRGIWTAKKRYALMVHDSEGVRYDTYKLKIMGMDLVKTSTPMKVREMLKESLKCIFEKDETSLHDLVSKMRERFDSMEVEEIAFPRSVNDLKKWSHPVTIYSSGCPIAVRAALLFNHQFKDNKDVHFVKDGEKVRFVYVKTPNPTRENVIGWLSNQKLPREYAAYKYIDYDKMWEKCFLSPLESITKAIGWTAEKQTSLEDFFT